MQACGLTLDSLIASSSSGLYCTMRPGSSAAACREDQLRLGILDPGRQFFRRKAAEHHRMHRADPRAGQHRDHGFRHHRHIEDDAVALGDAEILHDGGERLHLLQHLRIGEFRDRVGQRRIVDQRQLIGASARDMAVERVVAGVDHGAGEPAAIEPHRGIEDLLRRLDPVDLARRLGPKALGIGERAGMDLVIPAVVRGYSWRAPGRRHPRRHARACPGHPRLCFDKCKTWMAGTSPAMTAGRHFLPHCHGKLRQIKPEQLGRSAKPYCRAIVLSFSSRSSMAWRRS